MSLKEIIVQKIRTTGSISFHDFMDMALYYPALGYYTSPGEKIGSNGDFYTSPCYTTLFAKLIARQLGEMWIQLGRRPFTFVEYGAGTGIFCRDLLNELQQNQEFYDQLNYCIIEKSAFMRDREKEIVRDKVTWHDSIADMPPFTGCVFSNELVDNFPVHQVVMQDELMEVFLGYDQELFETLRPASDALKNYLSELNVSLMPDTRAEINLQATEWVHEIAAKLKKGFVLTFDYGYSSEVLYHHQRHQGTLVCYYKHRVNCSPYDNIGCQDITTHVNFSALAHWGLKNGLSVTGFTNQTYFLLGLGLGTVADTEPITVEPAGFLNSFLLDLGRKLKVLVQHKGITDATISGLRYKQSIL